MHMHAGPYEPLRANFLGLRFGLHFDMPYRSTVATGKAASNLEFTTATGSLTSMHGHSNI